MTLSSTPITVGRFGKVFGVLGWIKVISFTFPEENILKFKPWLIKKDGLWQELFFEKSKKQANAIIVKLPGCDSPEQATLFTNVEISILRSQLPKLKKGEYYWDDLVGLEVVNKEGVSLGVVEKLMATGANDVLVTKGDRKRLIPYISHVIQQVDPDNRVIHVEWGEDF